MRSTMSVDSSLGGLRPDWVDYDATMAFGFDHSPPTIARPPTRNTDALTPQLIRDAGISLEIAELHVAVARADAVRLMRLAQETTGAAGFRTLALVVHDNLRDRCAPDGARASPGGCHR